MPSQALLAGSIPEDGMASVLVDLEQLGTTGVLLFAGSGTSGEVVLRRGLIADDQSPRDDGRDTVELLLSLGVGEFVVYPKLPPLPVSRGTDSSRRGSLAVHPGPELMRYCEEAALTGRLLLERNGRIAIANYARGELVDVSIDHAPPDAFHEALEWEEGTFRVDTVIPRLSTPPPLPPTQGLVWTPDRDDERTVRIVHPSPLPVESATTAPVEGEEQKPRASIKAALFWVGVIFVMIAGCLTILALLPPLE